MELVVIAAVAENNVIGVKGKLPWNIPKDMKRFKELTSYHPVIMGRKTYQSIGKPLPNRLNVVLSKKKKLNSWGVFVASSLEEAIEGLKKEEPFVKGIDYSKCFVIGGQKVYEQALPLADRLEITHVHRKVKGNVYFPEIKLGKWVAEEAIIDGELSFVSYVGDKK
ncbi:dihydrofolate reductase [Candidatus Woesearchaeota archaeon]|nr:dihydrofolate reductase [Candidatus Woesearchaeota archaeon]